MAEIRNIIFDLGGVLLDLDFDKTVKDFAEMGFTPEMYQFDQEHSRYFLKFETGKITPADFKNGIRELLNQKDLSDDVLDEAWNAMILGFQPEKIELLKELAKTHRIFLLSNTNVQHEKIYSRMLKEVSGLEMKDLFEKYYYSHEVGLAKPDPAIFQLVLNENDLKPEETLYIDDSQQHIDTVQKLGMQGFLFPQNGDLKKIFPVIHS
ncbi:MAG: HAD family phosphatase [Bacteroidales bacterium]|nr:HAD family phosphatase [Bacteroidales bacterium]